MRLRLPAGCAGVSHAGRQLAVAADGTVAVEADAAADLAAHGLSPVAEPAGTGAGSAGRDAAPADAGRSGRRGR